MSYTAICFKCQNAGTQTELGVLAGIKEWTCLRGFKIFQEGDICGKYDEVKND
jgi:hypothetical protein